MSAFQNAPFQKKIPKKITEKYLYNCGTHYLLRFRASRAHFYKIMARRVDRSCAAHPELERADCLLLLEKVTVRLEREGFLNEESALRSKVRSLRRSGASAQAIQCKLMQKSFQHEQIAQALADYDEEGGGELTSIVRFMRRKKWGPFRRGEADDKKYQKELMALVRAGFSFTLAKRSLCLSEEEIEVL